MTDHLDDELRRAEEADAARQRDFEYYPPDAATLHGWIDEFSDDQRMIARWFLYSLRSATPTFPGLDPRFSENMPKPLDLPLPARWHHFLFDLVSLAPPSWSDTPWRKAHLAMLIGGAVAKIFQAPTTWDGRGEIPSS